MYTHNWWLLYCRYKTDDDGIDGIYRYTVVYIYVYAFNLDCRVLFVRKQNLVTKCLDNEEF